MGKTGKKYPAHQIARKKKFLMTRNHPAEFNTIKLVVVIVTGY